MKTLNLIGFGNDESNERSFFKLKMDELFQEYFNEILEKIKINDRIYEEQLPLSGRANEIDFFNNKEFDIDVVYTETEIIVIVKANQKNLERFKSLMLAYSKIED